MALTDNERRRLLVWSAEVAGMTELHHPRSGRLLGFIDDNGDCWRLEDSDHPVPDGESVWNPLVSLNQAMMVARKVIANNNRMREWAISEMYQRNAYAVISACDNRHWSSTSEEPAEALLMACADAAGEKWRDA